MKYLRIKNSGVLDVRLVSLMGGSTKSKKSYKIGQFGTGLKYVIAYMFRNGLKFELFCGENRVDMKTVDETIGDETFSIVYIDGQRTSITTNMGVDDWKPWMIIRELYSNALDEGGELYEVTENVSGSEGETNFYIEMSPEIMAVYNNWSKYFIVGNEPMFENEEFAIHPSGQTLKIYKQGILIHESEEQKSLFNYDIKNAQINELRQYRGVLSADVYRCLCNLDKKSITYFLENCKEGEHFESDMDYSWDFTGNGKFGQQWEEAIGNAKIIHQKAVNDIAARGLEIDLSSTITVPKMVYTALTKKFEGVGALRVADKIGEFFESYDEALLARVNKCCEILEDNGYSVHPELSFIIGFFGDQRTLAKIDIDKKEILISEKHADKPDFDIITMLVEENEHFRTGYEDCSRPFQQHFIDLYVNQLLNKTNKEA